jgi:hypothetical protein
MLAARHVHARESLDEVAASARSARWEPHERAQGGGFAYEWPLGRAARARCSPGRQARGTVAH